MRSLFVLICTNSNWFIQKVKLLEQNSSYSAVCKYVCQKKIGADPCFRIHFKIFFIDEAFLYISCTTSQVKVGIPCEVFSGRNNYRG